MKCVNYYRGMIDAATEKNVEKIFLEIILYKQNFSGEEIMSLYKSMVKKLYNYEMFKKIYSITVSFGIREDVIKSDSFLIYAYLRSLSRLEDFLEIISFSKELTINELKEDPELSIRIISRAYTFSGDRYTAIKVLKYFPSFGNKMQMAHNYILESNFEEALKICLDLKSGHIDHEQTTYINFCMAEIYQKKKSLKSLESIISDIRKTLYKGKEEFLLTRSLLLYQFLIFLKKDVNAYSFICDSYKIKAKSEMELNNKIDIIKILIKDYNFSKEDLLKEIIKNETFENYKKISNKI